MWLSDSVIKEVDKVARISYIDRQATILWNANRQAHDLRLLTGWFWETKNGKNYCQGFKTKTVAYRDAWYTLIAQREVPSIRPSHIKLVRNG